MVLKNSGEALSREAAVMRSLAKDIGALQEFGLAELRARYLEVYGEEARSKNLPTCGRRSPSGSRSRWRAGYPTVAQARIEELSSDRGSSPSRSGSSGGRL